MSEQSTDKEKNKPLFPGFWDPLRVIILVAVAITGLWISYSFIANDEKNPPFHEISWNPREIIQTLVTNARSNVFLLADSFEKKLNKEFDRTYELQKKIVFDSVKLGSQIDSARRKIGRRADSLEKARTTALDNIQQWLDKKSDSAIRADLSEGSSLFIHTSDLLIDDYKFVYNKGSSLVTLDSPFTVTYSDAKVFDGQLTGEITLPVKRYAATERFFNKYPGFGLWSLLLIIQTVFFCVLITGLLFHFFSASANRLYKDNLGFKPANLIYLLIGLVAFLLVIFLKLLNDDKGQLVSGKIFMLRLHDFFHLVNIIGYTAAGFCLAGMINCVIYMNKLKKESEKLVPAVDNSPATELKPENIEKLRTDIKQRFNVYFVFTAIILSLAIFASGTFFSSMNGMDFIKQIRKDQGFSPVNSDMVFIYGILNSFFLVLIYLPMRYMLVSLDKSIPLPAGMTPAPGTDGDKEGTKNTFFGKITGNMAGLKTALVAISPFLASLLQDLLDLLFSK
jgi:hypothetical protein